MRYRKLPEVLKETLSYNPDDVNIRLQHFRVYEIIEMIKGQRMAYDDEDLKLISDRPKKSSNQLDIWGEDDLQRNNNLWAKPVKSKFIESLMIRLPIPALYFDGSQKPWRIIDGLQRIYTIISFIDESHPDKFSLSGLDFLSEECYGKFFPNIPGYLRARILNAELIAYVINPGSPSEVKYNIFKRINTGGLKLNAQEIRNAFCKGIPADFTKLLAAEEMFKKVTAGKVTGRRMIDREYVTRFIAFQLYDYKEYNSNLDLFLTFAMKELEKMKQSERDELHQIFKLTLDRIYAIFKEKCMYRLTREGELTKNANKALFDALAWNFSKLSVGEFKELSLNKTLFVADYQEEFRKNVELQKSINDTTGKKSSVINRFEKLNEFILTYTS